RAAVGRERRAHRHGRVGHLLVPVSGHAGVGPAGPARGTGARAGGSRRRLPALECAHRARRPARSRHLAALTVARFAVRRLEDVPRIPIEEPGDPEWYPLQHYFGFTAFGANVYVASEAGGDLLGAHDETASRQEELYLVVAGEAAFTLDG